MMKYHIQPDIFLNLSFISLSFLNFLHEKEKAYAFSLKNLKHALFILIFPPVFGTVYSDEGLCDYFSSFAL